MHNAVKSTLMAIIVTCSIFALVSIDIDANPETDNVAAIGDVGYSTLQGALDTAKDGDTINLLTDIVLTGDKDNAGATIKSGVTIDGTKADGGCFTISTSTAYKVLATVQNADFGHELTLRNVNVISESTYQYSMCLWLGMQSGSLILDNVTLKTESTSNTQPLTIGGTSTQKIDVTIKNSTIIASSIGYSIISFNPVDMDIIGSYLKGWAVVYMKYQAASGTHGSVVNITDSEIVSINEVTGETNDFAAIVSEDRDVTFNLTDIRATIGETKGNNQTLFSSNPFTPEQGTNTFNIGGDATVVTFVGNNVNMLYTYQNNEYPAGGECEITGGTYTGIDTKEITQYISEELNIKVNSDGSISINEPEPTPQPGYDNDEDLPPFIPTQPKDSGDDVTIVACAAAAVVAALMAVFLIVSYKKD